jgi:hypothetical protein
VKISAATGRACPGLTSFLLKEDIVLAL